MYLDNTPWGCISRAYGWQAAVGTLGQLRIIGHRVARLADRWASPSTPRRSPGRPASWWMTPSEAAGHVGDQGARDRPRRMRNGVTSGRTIPRRWVDHRLSGAGQREVVPATAAWRRIRHQRGLGWNATSPPWQNIPCARARHARLRAVGQVIDFNDWAAACGFRHVAGFADAVGVGAAHFIGHSMGAVTCRVTRLGFPVAARAA